MSFISNSTKNTNIINAKTKNTMTDGYSLMEDKKLHVCRMNSI